MRQYQCTYMLIHTPYSYNDTHTHNNMYMSVLDIFILIFVIAAIVNL